MNFLIGYLLGLATPFILLGVCLLNESRKERKRLKRYSDAYKKFTDEYDSLTPAELEKVRAQWREEEANLDIWDSIPSFLHEKDRYFYMKWRHGFTTEI